MAKTVKNENMKKMPLTANMSQLLISKQLDKKSLTAWIMFHQWLKKEDKMNGQGIFIIKRAFVSAGGEIVKI
jgi:hypothetical protein